MNIEKALCSSNFSLFTYNFLSLSKRKIEGKIKKKAVEIMPVVSFLIPVTWVSLYKNMHLCPNLSQSQTWRMQQQNSLMVTLNEQSQVDKNSTSGNLISIPIDYCLRPYTFKKPTHTSKQVRSLSSTDIYKMWLRGCFIVGFCFSDVVSLCLEHWLLKWWSKHQALVFPPSQVLQPQQDLRPRVSVTGSHL